MLNEALALMPEVFDKKVLTLGQEYFAQDCVLSIRFSEGLVKARVKGGTYHIYDVHFDLRSWPKKAANCTCAQRFNCKHAAASLLALSRQLQNKDSQAKPSLSERSDKPSTLVFAEKTLGSNEVEWVSSIQEGSKDFFFYEMGLIIEGKTVSILPLVVNLIQRYDLSTLEKLPDSQIMLLSIREGLKLKVELGRIKPLVRLILQYGISRLHTQGLTLKLKPYQLMLIREIENAAAIINQRWQPVDHIRRVLLQLTQAEQLPEAVLPQGFIATLRDYQKEGLNWLQLLRANHFGGILADDMGLGKTVQTLAHLQAEKEQGRMTAACLIIAPTSLLGNWQAEAARFTPQLRVMIYHGLERHKIDFSQFDLVITTYGVVQRDKVRFQPYEFYYLILDEAQLIKNFRTKTTQVIHQLQAKHRLCLSGTPMENHLGELWSLFHFLMPGLLGEHRQFIKWFKTPIEKQGDKESLDILSKRVKPFFLRRKKSEVARELPPKTEIVHRIQLGEKQRDLYEGMRLNMEQTVLSAIAKQGLNRSHMLVLDALLKLRQICCDPRLLRLPEAHMAHGDSAKLEALMALLDNLLAEGRRVLVFSQFTSMLELIEKELIARQYAYLKLTGQTKNRQALVDQFQQGDIPLFLISLRAGGTGLNLTRADTVIHYDPWWNPAVEDQATDRTHRIGQKNPVFVYKLVTEGTVEQAITALQDRKRELVQGVLAENATHLAGLTPEDIEMFFK